MQIRAGRRSVALSGALALAATSAWAQSVSHEKSGLGISPPSGYEAKELPGRGQNSVIFSVKKPDDKDTGCQVGFAEAPQNATLDQAQINGMMKTKEHQDLAKASIAMLYETNSVAPFDNGHDVTGIEMISDIKPREGFPPRSQEIRNLMILLETPKGRTSVVCVGDKKDFGARREEFRQLARGVTPPK